MNRLANIFIGVFLVLQIAGPLSYYLGDNRFDERFAWRMFSPIRMARCSVTLYDGTGGADQRMRLSQDLHVVWINLLKRARTSVLDRYADAWCGVKEGRVLRADLVCTPPEAKRHPICQSVVDRDGDGVPDRFPEHEACAGRDPAACFAEMCEGQPAQACYDAHCSVRIVPRDLNLCEGR